MLDVKLNPAGDDLLIDGEICFSTDTFELLFTEVNRFLLH